MSRYRKIDTRIWNDAKFRALSDDGKLIFLLFLTHPNMTALGALPATLPGLAHGMKWLEERFRKGFGELLSQGMVEVDEEAGLICLPNFLRYNQPENPNVVKAWVGSVDMLPECPLKNTTMARAYASLEGRPKSFAEAFLKQFGKPSREVPRNRMPNQEQEQEPEQEQDSSALEGREDTYTHAREMEPTEYPIDPPSTSEEGRAFLKSRGVPASEMEGKLHKLMSWRLYPSEIAA